MKCKICSRDAKENNLCSFHSMAHRNIISKFEVWQKASNVSWADYLIAIQKNSLTGEWAKEVVNYLLMEEGKNVRKN